MDCLLINTKCDASCFASGYSHGVESEEPHVKGEERKGGFAVEWLILWVGGMLERRRFLKVLGAGALGAGGAFGYGRFVEANWFEVTRTKISGPFPEGLRILHLSDLHLSDAVPLGLIEAAVDRALLEEFDLVCLTGDFITDRLTQKAEYAAVLARLVGRAPCFACLGNHDGGLWAAATGRGAINSDRVKALLSDAGIRLLVNQAEVISINGTELEVVGLGDLWSRELRPDGVLRPDRQAKERPVLVLSHNPDSKGALAKYHWDLMLCGHTHGGQLVVPVLGLAPFAPVKDKKFVSGLKPWKGREIFVTRGVGNLHGMRINCRPEISILEA